MREASSFLARKLSLAFSSCSVASAAVHSLTLSRIEGHLASCAAVCAYGVEHLSGSLGAVLSCIAASLASLGLVLEALLSIELLLTCGEHEIRAAIFALQRLVLVHVFYLTLIGKKFFCPRRIPTAAFENQRSPLSYMGI